MSSANRFARFFTQPLSIQSLLITGYSIVVALLLILIVLMLYWVSVDVAEHGNDDFLKDEVRKIIRTCKIF